MSDKWIQGNNRLQDAVGRELANDILDSGYTRVVARIQPDGSISCRIVTSEGFEIKTFSGIFNP